MHSAVVSEELHGEWEQKRHTRKERGEEGVCVCVCPDVCVGSSQPYSS